MTELCRRLSAPDPAAALAAACNLAYARGLTAALAGNASCRNGTGFLCTAGGCCLGEVAAEDLVALDADWRPLLPGACPSSEWQLHAAIYRVAAGAGAVLHTHSPAATALAVLGRDVSALTPEMDHYLGTVPCLAFAVPGTAAVGQGVAAAIGRGARAALLGRHGAVAWGPDIRSAFHQAELLEACCALSLTVAGAGGNPR